MLLRYWLVVPIVVIAVNEKRKEFQWSHRSQFSRGSGWKMSCQNIWIESFFVLLLTFPFVDCPPKYSQNIRLFGKIFHNTQNPS